MAAAAPWDKRKTYVVGRWVVHEPSTRTREETRGTAAVMQPLCCISAFLKEFAPSLPGSSHSQQDSSDCRSVRDWSHAEQKAFTFKSLQVLRSFV